LSPQLDNFTITKRLGEGGKPLKEISELVHGKALA
jgi:hypothetical protein